MIRWRGPATFLTLLIAAIVCLAVVASSTGVALGETAHMDAARAIGGWFDRIGVGETSLFEQRTRDAIWSPIHQTVTIPTMLSAFVWHVATSGYEWWGELLSLRLGYVIISASSVPLLFVLAARAWGWRAGVLAAGFLAFVPRAVHQAALADPHALTVTGWLLVLVCYARARASDSRFGSIGWNLATGLALGLALGASHGALVVSIVLVVHTWWLERHALRAMLRNGLLPLPAVLLSIGALAPIVFYLSTPWLWHDTAARIRPLFIAAFSAPPGANASTFAALSLVTSVPAVTLFAAALGLAVLVGPRRLRGWACAQEIPPRGEGDLIVVALVIALAWPWITPTSLHASPPRWLLALPFIAALAGLGLDRTLRELSSRLEDRALAMRVAMPAAVGVLCLGVPFSQTITQRTTRSAGYTSISGGPAWIATRQGLPLHDGSPALALSSTIDGLGRSSVSVFGTEVAGEVWSTMRRCNLLRTTVRSVQSPAQADLVIVGHGKADVLMKVSAGGRVPNHLATVQRDGVVILSLYQLR